MKYISIICFFLGFQMLMTAQPLREIPYESMVEAAEESLEAKDYYNALDWFQQAYKERRDRVMALRIAELHTILRDYKKAANWYGRVLNRDKDNKYAEYRYAYARVLKYQENYKDAVAEFRFFLDLSEDEIMKNKAKLELEGILNADKLEENIGSVIQLANKNVNSPFTEYAPAEYSDGDLYFASFQRKEIITVGKDKDYHSKIYSSSIGKKGYGKAKALGEHINREGYHTGNVCFSADGTRMYYTRALLDGNVVSESKLYFSNLNGGSWTPAEEVPGINGEYEVRHPAVGELYGNEVLFFTSNMEGGQGGLDIYYSTIRGEGYDTPVNLGPKINSAADDITPYYRDGMLYFSSEGYPSLGGFDIYFSEWDGTQFADITNIGFGYNSSYDDMYFSLVSDGYNGYLVSNRPADGKRTLKSKTCCDDIFTFEIRRIVVDLLALVNKAGGELEGANITLYDLSDVEPAPPSTKSNLTGNSFNFLLDSDRQYKIVVEHESYYPDSLQFNTLGILDDYTVKKTLTLNPLPEPEPEIIVINQPIRLNNIYYDFDDDKILQDAEKDLATLKGLMDRYSDMVIELSSHTDSRGIGSYNERLSQRRANSAKVWLVESGVVADRIKAVGYGENKLLNHCANGVRCSEEEHQFNRRTEFKIIAGPQSIEITKEVIKE